MARHVHDRKRILRMKMGPGRRPGNNKQISCMKDEESF